MSGYFANEAHQPRVRRAHDAVTVGSGFVLLVWIALSAERLAPFEEALINLAQIIESPWDSWRLWSLQ